MIWRALIIGLDYVLEVIVGLPYLFGIVELGLGCWIKKRGSIGGVDRMVQNVIIDRRRRFVFLP